MILIFQSCVFVCLSRGVAPSAQGVCDETDSPVSPARRGSAGEAPISRTGQVTYTQRLAGSLALLTSTVACSLCK